MHLIGFPGNNMQTKRTGLRKPKNYLKMWGDPDWSYRMTPGLHVGMVDEWLHERERGRLWNHKSWYISLTQNPDLLKKLGGVKGLPEKGTSLLLFEDDVVALVQHLFDHDLIDFDDNGRVVNADVVRDAQRRYEPPLSAAEYAKHAKAILGRSLSKAEIAEYSKEVLAGATLADGDEHD
jgi:hypothetical protein